MKGLAENTQKIIESISQLECIKPYVLVGGTALSLQLGLGKVRIWISCRGAKQKMKKERLIGLKSRKNFKTSEM